jgi:hypothetical protein
MERKLIPDDLKDVPEHKRSLELLHDIQTRTPIQQEHKDEAATGGIFQSHNTAQQTRFELCYHCRLDAVNRAPHALVTAA